MDLLASFYNGLSGVNAMGQKLNVTANNVANVNTNSFKSGQTQFADIFESTLGSLSYGHGVQLGNIATSFRDGMIETTGTASDMAISGPGFFMVRQEDGTFNYTRSGDFKLTDHLGAEPNAQNLVTQTGHCVQGYCLSTGALSSPPVASDILIKNIAPQSATSQIVLALNLQNNPARQESVASPVNLFDSWDGTNTAQPIDPNTYDYKTSLTIYGPGDETDSFATPSSTTELTVYFGATTNPNEQEFIITCDPTSDQRLCAGGARYDCTTDKGAGALMYGVLSFSNSGDLTDIQCWNVPRDGNVDPASTTNVHTLARGESYHAFEFNFTGAAANNSSTLNFGSAPTPQAVVSPATAFSSATTSGRLSATSTWGTVSDSLGNIARTGDTITLQGITGDGTPASYTYTVNSSQTVEDFLTGLETQFACTAGIVDGKLTLTDTEVGTSQLAISSITHTNANGATPLTDPTIAQIFGNQGSTFTVDLGDRYQGTGLSTTNYASSSAILYQSQNGYGKGRLQDLRVDSEGIVTGKYSNGQNIQQAQVMMANFMNLQGLKDLGGNNFSATDAAGTATYGTAGQPSFGTVTNYALEMSNVDIGQEMVDIITTQRAFQANAKSLSTVDEMYDKLLQMVR